MEELLVMVVLIVDHRVHLVVAAVVVALHVVLEAQQELQILEAVAVVVHLHLLVLVVVMEVLEL